MARKDDIRQRALGELRRYEVLMLDGHFDYGNGYHGPAYLNPHQLLRYPSTIWRLAQDLLDLVPDEVTAAADVVAGPPTGGALLAHTIAGLLDSRRSLTHPPCSFAPFEKKGKTPSLRPLTYDEFTRKWDVFVLNHTVDLARFTLWSLRARVAQRGTV